MVKWEGLEDPSNVVEPVWLSRENETTEWKPLRKADCRALNKKRHGKVIVEGGRATADKESLTLKYNFFNIGTDYEICQSSWFLLDRSKRKKDDNSIIPQPIPFTDCEKIEAAYQFALFEFSSLGGSGPGSAQRAVLDLEIPLDQEDGKYVGQVIFNTKTETLAMKRRPASKLSAAFGGHSLLQRGYGDYKVEGEAEEMALGPVRHLIFVIHGIGEAMWTKDNSGVNSMVEEMNVVRAIVHKRQSEIWKRECSKAEREDRALPPVPNRIEFIPIQWYERIHCQSTSLMKSLNAVTLKTIPALRDVANDVIFDVLMYMMPDFCEETLDCVTTQMNDLYRKFHDVHKDFKSSGGKCSLVGHSLGTVIAWDLLSILKERNSFKEEEESGSHIPFNGSCVCSTLPTVGSNQAEEDKTWGPTLRKKMTATIPFEPDFTFFLGSPLGLFLSLRGAHGLFEEMRLLGETASRVGEEEEEQSAVVVTSPFTLPSGSVYNIFHPSDPIAYRIEPLLMCPDTANADIPAPLLLTTMEGGLRAHNVAKKIGEDLKKRFIDTQPSFRGMFATIQGLAGSHDSTERDIDKRKAHKRKRNTSTIKFALGGESERVDFEIQQGVIDNQYLSAVSAHTCYFSNIDVLDLIIEETAVFDS